MWCCRGSNPGLHASTEEHALTNCATLAHLNELYTSWAPEMDEFMQENILILSRFIMNTKFSYWRCSAALRMQELGYHFFDTWHLYKWAPTLFNYAWKKFKLPKNGKSNNKKNYLKARLCTAVPFPQTKSGDCVWGKRVGWRGGLVHLKA